MVSIETQVVEFNYDVRTFPHPHTPLILSVKDDSDILTFRSISDILPFRIHSINAVGLTSIYHQEDGLPSIV